MKKIILLVSLIVTEKALSQTIDSIAFHLYTDSLKKGTHNYINVDGRLSNGTWLPLSSQEIGLSTSAGIFLGNDLVLPGDAKAEYVDVTATLKQKPLLKKEIRIWIKKKEDDELLPSNGEYMDQLKKKKRRTGR